MEMFLVGGYVRDILFNLKSPSKDKDYLVVGCIDGWSPLNRGLLHRAVIRRKITARMKTPQGEWVDFV